jgi:hypothetical protein
VEISDCAVGVASGRAKLGCDSTFHTNQGTVRLEMGMPNEVEVKVETLDQLAPRSMIGILKIDGEGGELDVIAGARDLLGSRRVKYLVVEAQPGREKDLAHALTQAEYRPCSIERYLLRPVLAPSFGRRRKHAFEPLSLLAVRPGEPVPAHLHRWSWKCLASQSGDRS